MRNEFVTTSDVAKMLGISRVAVFKKVKSGEIKANLVGHTYMIPKEQMAYILGKELKPADKKEIDLAVKRTIEEYGAVLKLLGKE